MASDTHCNFWPLNLAAVVLGFNNEARNAYQISTQSGNGHKLLMI